MSKKKNDHSESVKIRQSRLSYLIVIILLMCVFLLLFSDSWDFIASKILKTDTGNKNVYIDPSLKSPYFSDEDVQGKDKVRVLCYHDIVSDSKAKLMHYDTKIETLKKHFEYFRDNNYKILSMDEYIKIAKGKQAAYKNSVLLTFDDGEAGFYRYVYPLLKKYDYHAVISVIGSKIGKPDKDEHKKYLDWDQIREMEKSGLVDTASHSYNLHHQEETDPWNSYGSASTQSFWSEKYGYESDKESVARIEKDLKQAQSQLKKELGHTSPAIIWPYGEFNQIGLTIALKNDFKVSMTMLEGDNFANTPQARQYVRRNLCTVDNQNEIDRFMNEKKNQQKYRKVRGVQISIDDLYIKGSKKKTAEKTQQLIQMLKKDQVNSVFLKTYSEKGVYFNTKHAPVIENIYNSIASRFVEEDFFVYAAMPTLSSSWLVDDNDSSRVKSSQSSNTEWYHRSSPFSKAAIQKLENLYSDFAKQAIVNGILFQEDLYLSQYEDFSTDGKNAYLKRFDKDLDTDIYKDKKSLQQWQQWKNEYLIDISKQLMNQVRVYRPLAISMREMYGDVTLSDQNAAMFSQDYNKFLQQYDIVVITSYPHLRPGETMKESSEEWLKTRIESAMQTAGGKSDKIVFKIQTDSLDKDYLTYMERFLEDYKVKHMAFFPKTLEQ